MRADTVMVDVVLAHAAANVIEQDHGSPPSGHIQHIVQMRCESVNVGMCAEVSLMRRFVCLRLVIEKLDCQIPAGTFVIRCDCASV
jgi:hypothetical protein